MATTVNNAFDEFLREKVNLDAKVCSDARSSRDWLRNRLHGFDDKHDDFPFSYQAVNIDFGSFARRTKLSELDDVDLIHGLSANGAHYNDLGRRLEITVPSPSRLTAFRHDDTQLLNSRKVIEKFRKHLKEVPQYSASGTNRRGEAAVLNLKTYPWSFDIVPGFFTAPEWDGRTYYIIPDGEGHWKKTDPRMDQDRVTSVNQKHEGRVLNVIRLLKYWNRRPTMPSMGSYLLENMLLTLYEERLSTASRHIDVEVAPVLDYLASAVHAEVPDPKQIQGNLNTLGWEEATKIQVRAETDAEKAREARQYESDGDHEKSIAKWAELFGPEFPAYTGARSSKVASWR